MKKDRRRINKVSVTQNPNGDVFVFGEVGTKDSFVATICTVDQIGFPEKSFPSRWMSKERFDELHPKMLAKARSLFEGLTLSDARNILQKEFV